jgi:molybdate transport system substrate-binding protein
VRRLAIAALLLLCLATPSLAVRQEPALRVFAAASLAGAFGEIAREFERTHPGASVELNLAGSQQLATQIEHGAKADVFASADARWMEYAREKELLSGEATVFARNRLVVIVPRSNPARIGTLRDLARRGVKLVLGADAVPVGAYSRQLFQRLSRSPGFPADYVRRVLANLVSEEENVKSVLGKVQLGEADAGVVYRSDVTPVLERYVRTIAVPQAANVIATYPIAVLAGASRGAEARAFIDLALSAKGQSTLAKHGLLRADSTP